MTLHNFINQSYQNLLQNIEDKQILLLHPNSKYRSVVVARLLGDENINTLYYAMRRDDLNLASFIYGMTHTIASQYALFGRNVNLVPEEIYADSEKIDILVEQFAHDLAEVSDQPYLFILDEYDRADTADDVQRFVERLVTYLPDNCKLLINSRTLPRLPWMSLIARNKALMVRDETLITENHYEINAEGNDNLDIFALGPGQVLMNGQEIHSWEGHLPRLLFFFALDKPVVTRSEICNAFWPDLENEQAVNVFHVTKRRLHKALDMDVLVHIDGYYRVNPDLGLKYDILEFVTTLIRGRDTSLDMKSRMKAWAKAIELYKGPFLHGHNDPWIVERREEFKVGYMEALISMANVRMEEDRKEQALSLYLKAIAEDESREDIHQQIMRLYAQMGRRSEAAAHYKALEKPSAETAKLYKEIMS